MSLFSRLKRRRVQAKDKNSKNDGNVKEKAKEEPAKVPYKHVVMHAASDMLLVAPASAREEDNARVIELNKQNIAKARSECKAAGMPRVRDSLSIYKTPIFPLPKNYKPYSVDDRPKLTYYPPQLAGSQKGPDNSSRPESLRSVGSRRSGISGKGKEPEYIRSPLSLPPVPRLSHEQSSTITSSKDAPLEETSAISSTPNDESRINNKAVNRLSHSSSYQPSISQKSLSFSEKSYQTPFTISQTTVGAPVKSDRYYPPPTKSAYFSASHTANQGIENKPNRQENKNISGTETAIPPASGVAERDDKSTPPVDEASFGPSTTSIGPAIAPPRPPCIVAPPPAPCSTEEAAGLEHNTSKTTTTSGPRAKTPQNLSVEKGKAPAYTTAKDVKEQDAIAPLTSSPQKKARRLSKPRPSSSGNGSGNGKSRLSIDASQRSKSNSTAPGATVSELDRASHVAEPKTSEASKESSELTVKIRKLHKKPKDKSQRRKWWSFGRRSTTAVH
ncbi:hypothetical protein F4813DRAFT_312403 [Daldinia decipiens]|uniref:uncharacterized protein n=1 Tax=Daldinia decipiens TaxID=326647 RepID=UPI0020C4EE38|nr:uncharacterized protein F4813DRAFT_312403 [Daldinia decipiens]KAI1660068.1 hypothetical protein F4813DRAFT_312403 [Daldinia decipiens]